MENLEEVKKEVFPRTKIKRRMFMKRMAFAVCVAVLVFAVGAQAQTPAQTETGKVEQELIKLEKEWADALVKHDWTFLDRILADDYVVTDPEGNVSTRAQEIAFLKSGEFAVTSCVHHELKVRVYGDAAIVTGHTTTKETYKGRDFVNNLRWTDTWVNSAGRWRCVAGHSSLIAQK
jgi:ketosteroid isomerase-like protein